MRSRFVGVCLSGYTARISSAFVLLPTRGGAIGHAVQDCAAAACDGASTRAPPLLRRNPARRYISCGSRGGPSSLSSSAVSGAEVEVGQDSGEMFDVFLPPKSLSALSEPPRPAGFTKARALVHADGDWHRSVHIWLHNSKGELVLQKRSASKDTFPGMWDVSVGGHFTAGDSSLETAIKETSEELGLDSDENSLRFVCTVATTAIGTTPMHGDFVCNEYKDIYLLRYDGPVTDLKFGPSEVDEVKLVPMDQLRDAYESQDPTYIPRPSYYLEPLFEALKEAIQ